MGDRASLRLLPYEHRDATLEPPDPDAPRAADALARWMEERIARIRLEHFGSTAVAGLPGKGVLDLLLLYDGRDPAALPRVRDAVDSLGFGRQTGRDPWPESRPMRVAVLERAGRRFRVHVHVVDERSPEAALVLRFRDRLRTEPDLRARYAALKASILEAGIVDSLDYSMAKSAFIEAESRAPVTR